MERDLLRYGTEELGKSHEELSKSKQGIVPESGKYIDLSQDLGIAEQHLTSMQEMMHKAGLSGSQGKVWQCRQRVFGFYRKYSISSFCNANVE